MRCRLLDWIVIGAIAGAPPPLPGQEPDAEPQRTSLVETTETRLAQIDVTVTGPREAIADLAPEDFQLAVGLERVEDLIVDNLCVLPGETPAQEVEVELEERAAPEPVVPPRPRTSFLFYFDQHHLTMAGRANSIDLAQEIIPELIVDGNRGMIISAGKELHTFSELTDDPAQLMQALRTLNADHTQWDPWVQAEDDRVEEVVKLLNEPPYDFTRARSVARSYQREERWRTQKALHLFSMVLGRMSELDPPKAVVYFADTMRANAGDHYMSFFSRRAAGPEGDGLRDHTFTAAHAFDRVLEEATSMGTRVFTIEARGLTTSRNIAMSSPTAAASAAPNANTQALKDAQNALVGMARESGGRSFLNGIRARKIVAQIEEDLSCVYLLSFDASRLSENTTHRVVVRVDRPNVKVHARGQFTVQSESRRLTSRLMAAFASPQNGQEQFPVRQVVIPTGYQNGKYSALVQLHVPGSPLAPTSWDLGVSLIARGEVAADASGRVSVDGPGVPVVLETEMSFRPGPVKIVGVVHETTADDVGTGEIEVDWPDPDQATVTVGPIAVLQPAPAAILRGEVLRDEGAIGIREGDLARTDRPTALVGIICRAKGARDKLRVERKLVGTEDSSAPFGMMKLDLEGERCAQIRDFIPADSMSSGMFSYEIHVFSKKEEVASAVRQFAAASPDEYPAVTGLPPP